ncbi:hypothetical protein D1646_12015 [Pseudoflavonifractor sp. 60]|uniref:hypothetical protein n=1 Tax=Pseudoflavonifractor sp. 60 TaxID=2304576 RepID=UPI00136CCF94|nr:hypothetical protein [Pseudoflavonifractor sp. 60]NBI67522.1 hypothetical protein [Pseudoflavonifractor sp. 60]
MPDFYNKDLPGRYGDLSKFVTDPDRLELTRDGLVYLSAEEDYDIAADLSGQEEKFIALRPQLASTARNLGRLDDLVQRCHQEQSGGGRRFPYSLEFVYLDKPYLILEYWGMIENTTFDVVFRQEDGKFIMESFGMRNNLPPDWSVEFA